MDGYHSQWVALKQPKKSFTVVSVEVHWDNTELFLTVMQVNPWLVEPKLRKTYKASPCDVIFAAVQGDTETFIKGTHGFGAHTNLEPGKLAKG